MGKPGGSGGGGKSTFDTTISGDGSVNSDYWHSLGVIPTGQKIYFGTLQATSPDKSITFEVRTNLAGQSVGTDGATLLLAAVSATVRSGTKILDMYKNGRLHTVSVIGTGTEKFWIRLKSKGSSGAYLFNLNHTLE